MIYASACVSESENPGKLINVLFIEFRIKDI